MTAPAPMPTGGGRRVRDGLVALLRAAFQAGALASSGCGCGGSIGAGVLGLVALVLGALLLQGAAAIPWPAATGSPGADLAWQAATVVLMALLGGFGLGFALLGVLLAVAAALAVGVALLGALAAVGSSAESG